MQKHYGKDEVVVGFVGFLLYTVSLGNLNCKLLEIVLLECNKQ